jgi:transcriptional regulator with XRE-family HTH domain
VNHLRALRRERRLTLSGLAVKACTSPAWLVHVERYGHLPGSDLRHRIATALDVPEHRIWPELQEAET